MRRDIDVLVVGYAGYDLAIGPVPADIMHLDTGTAPQRTIGVGGDGINAATAFARLGLKTALATAVGRDAFAETVMAHLETNGILTDYVTRLADTPTAFTLLLIGADGERHCLVRRGCTEKISRAMIPEAALLRARHLHYASFFPMKALDPDAGGLLTRAKELGLTVSMDAVHYKGADDPLKRIASALSHVDLFMPGLADARALFGCETFEAMKAAARPFNLKYFGVKCGADGLYLTDFTRDAHMPALCRGPVVDTTGAGDTCVAAAAAAFLSGAGLTEIAAFAAADAALVVAKPGATDGCGAYAEVAALAREAAEKFG